MRFLGSRHNDIGQVREAITDIIGENSLVAVDVGARGDIPALWLSLDGVADFVSFDADPEACERLRHVYASRGSADRYRVLAVAIEARNARDVFEDAEEVSRRLLELPFRADMTMSRVKRVCQALRESSGRRIQWEFSEP